MQSKHRDYEPFEMGENMEEDLGMFEAAMTSSKVQLDFSPVSTILTVVDGSNQEATCRRIASEVTKRLSATCVETVAKNSASEIIKAADEAKAGLIILPVPCGEDIGQTNCQSLGTVTDSLLQGCAIPLLCVRDPIEENLVSTVFDRILVALSRQDRHSANSVTWAFRFATTHSKTLFLELADRASIAEASRLLQGREESDSIEEAAIGRAVTSRLGGLIGAAQKHAQSHGLHTHVDFRLGNPVKETLNAAQINASGFIIVSRPDDHTSAGYHLAEDLLLATRNCVMVI